MSSQEAASLLPLPSHVHPRQVADASCTASHGTSLLKSSNGGLVPFPKKALRSAPSPKNSRRLATVSHTLRLVKFPHSQLQLSVSYVSDLTTFCSQRNPAPFSNNKANSAKQGQAQESGTITGQVAPHFSLRKAGPNSPSGSIPCRLHITRAASLTTSLGKPPTSLVTSPGFSP